MPILIICWKKNILIKLIKTSFIFLFFCLKYWLSKYMSINKLHSKTKKPAYIPKLPIVKAKIKSVGASGMYKDILFKPVPKREDEPITIKAFSS